MILAHFTDTHLIDDDRLPLQVSALRRGIRECVASGVDLYLVTGDLAGRDAPHKLTQREREALADIFREMSKTAPVVVIRGNHDTYGDLGIFRKVSSVWPIVVREDVGVDTIGSVKITSIPWMPKRKVVNSHSATNQDCLDALRSMIEESDGSDSRIFLAHYPVEGIKVGDYEIQSTRDITLTKEWIESFGYNYFALGHIHQKQKVARDCYYAGSPYPTEFGHASEKRGFSLFDTSSKSMKYVELDAFRMVEWKMSWSLEGGWRGEQPKGEFVKIVVATSEPFKNIPIADLRELASSDGSKILIEKYEDTNIREQFRGVVRHRRQGLQEALSVIANERGIPKDRTDRIIDLHLELVGLLQ